jgi:hypothetical protein
MDNPLGEYQRDYPNSDFHRFGSPTTEGVWRLLLVERGDRAGLARVRAVLGHLLDRVAAARENTTRLLEIVAEEFINDRLAMSHYDWRYYLVRYPTMREGNSGIYYGAHKRLGYELTMLRKTVQNSWYRDAYLYAIWCEAGRPSEVEDPWFYGYSTTPRWMKLTRSGTGLRSTPTGIAIQPPPRPEAVELLLRVCSAVGVAASDEAWLLPVPQVDQSGELIDSEDRVQIAAGFLQDLLAAGL